MVKKINVRDVDVFIEGEGSETIVMIHGWPDTYRLWDKQVKYLKKDYRCVRFSLPGYDIEKKSKYYTLQDQIDTFKAVIDMVSPHQKVILMLHDWGSVFGYQYYLRNKDRVKKIVGVDVGDAASRKIKLPFKAKVFVMVYQLWLAHAWLLRNSIGNKMTRKMAKLLKAPGDPNLMHAGMNYPYYLKWKPRFVGKKEIEPIPFMPECPMLFLFGTQKPVMFHTQDFINHLNKQEHSQVVARDTSHWVSCYKPDEFNEIVGKWLTSNEKETTKASNQKVFSDF